jgi:hypothetical protein
MKTKVQADGNCVIVRLGGKEAGRRNRESMNKKALGGRVRGASWHKTAKPCRLTHTVKVPAVRGKFTPLSGEILTPQGGQEVSRRHSSPTPGVMPRTRRRPEQRSQGGQRSTREEAQTQKRGADSRSVAVTSALRQNL